MKYSGCPDIRPAADGYAPPTAAGVPGVIALLLCLAAGHAWADRISDMPKTERCIYEAKLAVAGYYHFRQGRPREAVRIHWHGDETDNEIAYVNRVIDAAYTRAAALKDPGQVSEIAFGDQTYEACMAGQSL